MIVRINGIEMVNNVPMVADEFEKVVVENYKKKDVKKLQKLCTWLWTISGTMFAQAQAFASSNLWVEMKPIFGLFQEIGMVLGAFAIIGGLIIMIFRKRMATKIIGTAAIAVGGVFLVPSAIMLIAIIGSMMNEALTTVFSGLDIGGSVKVNK